ncbi:hypothetical protein D3C85_1388360 [compost metagenome]
MVGIKVILLDQIANVVLKIVINNISLHIHSGIIEDNVRDGASRNQILILSARVIPVHMLDRQLRELLFQKLTDLFVEILLFGIERRPNRVNKQFIFRWSILCFVRRSN